MSHPPLFKNTKSIEKLKNWCKKTKKGYIYKIGDYKKRHKDKQLKNGVCYYLADYGDKLCFYNIHYTPSHNGWIIQRGIQYWFKVKKGYLVISSNRLRNTNEVPHPYTNITNKPTEIFCFRGGSIKNNHNVLKERFRRFFVQWSRRNGLKIKKKYLKYDIHNLFFVLSYPGIEFLYDIFPETKRVNRLNSFITPDLRRAKGYNDLLRRCVGNHGKKIKNILVGRSTSILPLLVISRTLKGIISPEFLDDFLRNNHRLAVLISIIHSKFECCAVRYFFRKYSKVTITNWLTTVTAGNRHNIIDTANHFYRERKNITLPENTNNIREIHDRICGIRNDATGSIVSVPQFYDYTEYIKKYAGINLSWDDWRIEIPKDRKVLEKWAAHMSNCIARAYSGHYIQNGGLLLGIYKKDKLLYNISINSQKYLDQFKARFNEEPPKEDKEMICKKLEELKLLRKHEPAKMVFQTEEGREFPIQTVPNYEDNGVRVNRLAGQRPHSLVLDDVLF